LKPLIKLLIAITALGMLVFSYQAEAFQVTVLMTDEGAAFQEFAQAFKSEAQKQKLLADVSQSSSLPTDADLIVAVGIKAAVIAANSHSPVLCVLVSKAGFDQLMSNLPPGGNKNNISAIYLDQPIKRQIAMIAAVLPEAKKIGLLFSASADVVSYRKAIVEKRLGLFEQKLASPASLFRDLESVLENSDVLLSLPDPEVYNSLSMRNILLATYRSKIPLAGFSPAYVKAGALCAVYSTQSQVAAQAVLLSRQFVTAGVLPAPQYPREFEVLINHQVANSLGIHVRENSVLTQEINSAANTNVETE
jgi:ABC-type uncharacterized transport system substrate-binding protein